MKEIEDNIVDALVGEQFDGISQQNNRGGKMLPNRQIWADCLRVMKPGAFGVVFSSVKSMHRLMVDMEDCGFLMKDVIFWEFLSDIEETNTNSYPVTEKRAAHSLFVDKNIKPSYLPIILIQKPLEKGLKVAQNIIKYGTGALNFEETRIPYHDNQKNVGHNPHPKGRVPANILRTEKFDDGYDKYFTISDKEQNIEDFAKKDKLNNSENLLTNVSSEKPLNLLTHLIKLVSFKGQLVLDPFMDNIAIGEVCKSIERKFIGNENEEKHLANIQLTIF